MLTGRRIKAQTIAINPTQSDPIGNFVRKVYVGKNPQVDSDEVKTMDARAVIELDKVFELVISQGAQAQGARHTRLDALFADLRRNDPVRDPNETMELIWAIWIDHQDSRASHRMIAAVEAISAGARDLARPILDGLVEEFPDWPEAWNKRATLAFMEKRDVDSIYDIARTLELEPRHFGAILGFAQICLRHGRVQEAKAAFEIALKLNPHINGLQEVVEDLAASGRTLH